MQARTGGRPTWSEVVSGPTGAGFKEWRGVRGSGLGLLGLVLAGAGWAGTGAEPAAEAARPGSTLDQLAALPEFKELLELEKEDLRTKSAEARNRLTEALSLLLEQRYLAGKLVAVAQVDLESASTPGRGQRLRLELGKARVAYLDARIAAVEARLQGRYQDPAAMESPDGRPAPAEEGETTPAVPQAGEPWRRGIQRQLDRKVSFEFVETPFEDCIRFLQNQVPANLVLDPALRQTGQQKIAVSLRLREMDLRSALSWLCKSAGCQWDLKDEAIHIWKGTVGNEMVSGQEHSEQPARISVQPGEATGEGRTADPPRVPEGGTSSQDARESAGSKPGP